MNGCKAFAAATASAFTDHWTAIPPPSLVALLDLYGVIDAAHRVELQALAKQSGRAELAPVVPTRTTRAVATTELRR